VHPINPFGHLFFVISGHISQAIPQTPIFMVIDWTGVRAAYLSECALVP
jgi:hypothetical protein